MKGKIKMYNAAKGFGFISGEDKNDYFFHVSQVKSADIPEENKEVEFDPGKNKKGFVANEVEILEVEDSEIIVLGDEKIKVSHIKDYGIAPQASYYQRVYIRKWIDLSNKFERFIGWNRGRLSYAGTEEWYQISQQQYEAIAAAKSSCYHIVRAEKDQCLCTTTNHGEIRAPKDGLFDLNRSRYVRDYNDPEAQATSSDIMKQIEDYLYIRTHQGKEYTIYDSEVDFSIHDKLNEIKDILT